MTSLRTQLSEIRVNGDSELKPRSESAPQTAESDSNASDDHSIAKDDAKWATRGLIREHSRIQRMIRIGLVVVVVCAVWSVWPLSSPKIPIPSASLASVPAKSNTTFDSAPFESLIWSLAALPSPPPAPPPPPPAVKLQLIAITFSNGGQYHATLYDSSLDKLISVREGDTAGDRTVTKITKTAITISYTGPNRSSPSHHHVLALDVAASEDGGQR